jgi:hypothetical protein
MFRAKIYMNFSYLQACCMLLRKYQAKLPYKGTSKCIVLRFMSRYFGRKRINRGSKHLQCNITCRTISTITFGHKGLCYNLCQFTACRSAVNKLRRGRGNEVREVGGSAKSVEQGEVRTSFDCPYNVRACSVGATSDNLINNHGNRY